MRIGREITGLARSIGYDLRRSRRARMYLIVTGFSFAAVFAAAVTVGQMPGWTESVSQDSTTEHTDGEIGPAGVTEQQSSSAPHHEGAFSQGVRPSESETEEPEPTEDPTTESGEWEQPSESPSSSPQPEPSTTTPSPEPSDSDSPSPSETPSGKE